MTSVNCEENYQGYNVSFDNITIQARAASAAKPGAIRPPPPARGARGTARGEKAERGFPVSQPSTPAGERRDYGCARARKGFPRLQTHLRQRG